MSTELTLYECAGIMAEFDRKAAENDGELSAEDVQLLTVAQTTSMEKLSGLVGYIKHLEAFDDLCEAEIKRIQDRQRTAVNRLENIKMFLLPYVATKGHVDIGTVRLSIRKSKAVELEPDFNHSRYMTVKTTATPDKKAIAEELKANPDLAIKGATLVTREHLQIK
jgi:hypothetical protein